MELEYSIFNGGSLIPLNGACFVTLEDLEIYGGRRAGVAFQSGGSDNILKDCRVRGFYRGVYVGEDVYRNTIDGCDVYEMDGDGIVCNSGDKVTLTPGMGRITNCHIYRFGVIDKFYRPGVVVDGVGNYVANNLIHDAPHSGIIARCNEHILEYNEVFQVCKEANDSGPCTEAETLCHGAP